MKVRTGFVSNSSSSSFTCDVCGETSSGWDLGLEDAYMYECRNGHIFCEGHIVEFDEEKLREEALCREQEELERLRTDPNYYSWYKGIERAQIIQEVVERISNLPNLDSENLVYQYAGADGEGSHYEYTPLACPICQHTKYTNIEAVIALKKEFKLEEQDVMDIVKKHIRY